MKVWVSPTDAPVREISQDQTENDQDDQQTDGHTEKQQRPRDSKVN